MTDIVKRLRRRPWSGHAICQEAADEIERLQRRLSLAETTIKCFEADRIEFEAEIERLRAALEAARALLQYHKADYPDEIDELLRGEQQ